MTAYSQLMAYNRVTQALGSVAGRTGGDQETVMPAGSGALRAEEMSALETVLHERRTAPQIAEWLEAANKTKVFAALDAANKTKAGAGCVTQKSIPHKDSFLGEPWEMSAQVDPNSM